VILAHVGQLEHELGRFEAARAKLAQAIQVQREVGDRAWEGIVLGMLGNLDLEQDLPEEALEHFQESVMTLTGSSYRRNAGLSLASLGLAEALSGRSDGARRAFERAREILSEAGSPSDREACALLELAADVGVGGPDARERANRRHDELASRSGVLPDEVRFALRIVRRAVDRALVLPRPSRPAPALEVGARASWFSPPGGERVDLSRRGPLRRLLLTLVERRASAPGSGVSLAELARGAWPEASEGARGLSSRVYVGVGTLRRLGLGALLARGEDGYLLDPSVELVWTRSESGF
jgi:tetratricopeptide (TPR) repeat protein